jgi:hypothetical protein
MTDNDKALVERLREAQCPDNMGCNPLAKYCQCVPMDEAAERIEALCRAIKQHEAFKQEVSDACRILAKFHAMPFDAYKILDRFIIPKPQPDPLVEALKELAWDEGTVDEYAGHIRAALEARGLEIREKGQ